MAETNWAGNIIYGASRLHHPRSVAEVQAIVRGAAKVRGLGSRHSFNTIADTDADLVSLRHLNRVIGIDTAAGTVTVEGGITYGELCPQLQEAGHALANLASLPHISVVGAVMTATHGSGNRNGNLATAVAALEFVAADGEIVKLARGDSGFDGAVVSLGALGLVTSITLDIMPSFDVRQDVYEELPFATLAENFEALSGAAYSASFFTDWRGDTIEHVWLKSRADAPFSLGGDFHGARLAARKWHPIGEMDATTSTEQMGVAGAWHERLPHFRIDLIPSAGEEIQSEYFVARTDAPAALRALHAVQDQFSEPLFVSEVRTIAADELWLSTAYQRDSVAFHFTFRRDWPAVRAVLPVIEQALAPFGARPHWGKQMTMGPAEVQALYPRMDDFRQLLAQYDPGGKFRNAFVESMIFS